MKTTLLLIVMLTLVSCGKKTEKSTKSYSVSDLKSQGINFVNYNGSFVVICENNGTTTNQQRVEGLTNFKNSLGIHNSKTVNFSYAGVTLSPAQLETVLNSAINSLQPISYLDISQDTQCPAYVLANS